MQTRPMSNQTCTHCQFPIPAGEAVIRSISFKRVSWHRDCYAATHPVAIPAQRGERVSV